MNKQVKAPHKPLQPPSRYKPTTRRNHHKHFIFTAQKRTASNQSFATTKSNNKTPRSAPTQLITKLIHPTQSLHYPTHFTHFARQSRRRMSTTTTTDNNSPSSSPEMGSKVKIYTKTGDKGTTTLYNMERLSKTADYFDALGNTDEVNSTIGLSREYFTHIPAVMKQKKFVSVEGFSLDNDNNNNNNTDNNYDNAGNTGSDAPTILDVNLQLQIIQSRLLDIGSCIATPITTSQSNRLSRVEFSSENIDQLEHWIDAFDAQLPPLTVFILPSGGLTASTLHMARTITRRAERSVIPLVERGDLDEGVMKYLNRLSDYLFIAARYCAQLEQKPEVTYKKPTPRQIAKAQENHTTVTGWNQ